MGEIKNICSATLLIFINYPLSVQSNELYNRLLITLIY